MSDRIRRREFLRRVGLAGAATTVGLRGGWAGAATRSPNERLNIGVIGTANRAEANIDGVQGENIVAICDIDDLLLGRAGERFPKAKTYHDFRKFLDHPGIDAVVVSTPDHIHIPATLGAIRRGKHVYCEKPLSHTVHEARLAAEAAKEAKVATQVGTQIHAGDNYRRVVELVQAGAIGTVREAHCWVEKSWGGGDRPTETPPVPANLHWELWLGPAPERPYNPAYQPFNWRGWWDFGGGTLADMGCHHIDLPFWALGLRAPTRVEAEGPPVHPESTPAWLIVRYDFPARGDRPPIKLTWYDGGKRPPQFAEGKLPRWGDGTLFVGDKGMLLAGYDRHVLLPEEEYKDYQRPEPSIPSSIGHHAEWIEACKTGRPTTCNFDYSGALTEAVLLGNVSYRVGQPLEWDAAGLRATNCPEADRFLRKEYREGWSL